MFDKRYKVYATVDSTLTNILSLGGRLDPDALGTFRTQTAHAEFLFGQDVINLISNIFDDAMTLAPMKDSVDRYVMAHNRFQAGSNEEMPFSSQEFADIQASHNKLLGDVISKQANLNKIFRTTFSFISPKRPFDIR
jgi:hypothetical protein